MEQKKDNQSTNGTQKSSKMSLRINLTSLTPQSIRSRIRGLDNTKLHEMTTSGEFYTLARIGKVMGLEPTQAVIKLHLVELDEVMNLSRRLNESMVKAIAEDVYDTGYILSFEELTRFFKELRQGIHGSMYQGMNSENVCKALGNFIQSRTAYVAQQSENESNSWKVRRERSEDEAVNLTVDEMRERFNARFPEANDK